MHKAIASRILFFVLVVLCWAGQVRAQNLAPIVSNVRVSVAYSSPRQITILYDVEDSDSDVLTVFLTASADSGKHFQELTGVSGDVGSSVTPGKDRKIIWDIDTSFHEIGAGLESGLVRVSVSDNVQINIAEILSSIDSNRMKEDVRWIQGVRQRTANPSHMNAVIDSIISRFSLANLAPWAHSFAYGSSYIGRNIIGARVGERQPESTVYLCGHFDTVNNSPGADDNASAIAALFAIARALEGIRCESTIRFAVFDLEEIGLVGSYRYTALPEVQEENILGALVLECIGYYSEQPNSQSLPLGFELLFPQVNAEVAADSYRGNFILNVANDASASLRDEYVSAAQTQVPDLKVVSVTVPGNGSLVQDLRRSDHASFWDIDAPALMLTDAANYRNPHYHKGSDSLQTLHFGFASNVAKAALATALNLAKPIHGSSALSPGFDLVVTDYPTLAPAPQDFLLGPSYPNPARDLVCVSFRLRSPTSVTLRLYNTFGVIVRERVETRPAGTQALSLSTHGLLPGVYLYQVLAHSEMGTGRMIIAR